MTPGGGRARATLVLVAAVLPFAALASVVPSLSAVPATLAHALIQETLSGVTEVATIEVDGLQREVIVYIPASLPPSEPVPLILFFHPGGGNAIDASRNFGLSEEAELRGFIAVYPNGSELPQNTGTNRRNWNDGRLPHRELPDDVRFVRDLLRWLQAEYWTDSPQVFAMGFSNGGSMAYRLACDLADEFAAIGVSAAPIFAPSCEPGQSVSILHIHGASDPMVPYDGGEDRRGAFPPVRDVINFWRTHNVCPAEPETSTFNPVVELETYGPCSAGSEVRLYTIYDGYHCWPGLDRPTPNCPPGGLHMTFAATPLVVEFLLAHPRQDVGNAH